MDQYIKKHISAAFSFIKDPYIKKHIPVSKLFIDIDMRPLQKREQEKDQLKTQKAHVHLQNIDRYRLKGLLLQN